MDLTLTYIPCSLQYQATAMSHRILCVDPDEGALADTVETLRAGLAEMDPSIETATTAEHAESTLTRDTTAVITEYSLPDGTGFDVVKTAGESCPDAGCVLYTDTDPDSIDTTDLRGAVTEYVGKGSVFGADRLAQLVRTTIERRTQTTYPVPQNETERLAALRTYALDDPGLVSSLDRITDLAATHFGVHTASINMINEHSQDFLACYGDAEDWESMDREDSICTFTILEDAGVMSVEDVAEDPRFESRSERLIRLGIHAYMGATLATPAGLVIGTLCVYDDQPRSFAPDDEAYLRKLAATAIDLIEFHSRVDAPVAAGEGER